MSNPYTQYVTADGQPAVDGLRIPGSTDTMFNRQGELNASDNKEAMQHIAALLQAVQSGGVRQATMADRTSQADAQRKSEERRAFWQEAVNDTSGKAMGIVGETFAESIKLTMGREGLARNILITKPIENGRDCRIRVSRKDVTAWRVTGPATVAPSRVKAAWFEAEEYKLIARILVDNADRLRADGDILEEKRLDGLEQIFKAEDEYFIALCDAAAVTANDLVTFATFTPTTFQSMRSQIRSWGNNAVNCIIGYSLWDDIVGGTDFSDWFDPVHKYELIMAGELGSMLGVRILTDGIRERRLRVMNSTDAYMFAAPDHTGAVMERQAVKSRRITGYDAGLGEEGWFLEWIGAMGIANSYSVVKASAS